MSRAAYMSGTADAKAEQMLTTILECINEADVDALKSLFSINALNEIENIEEKLKSLIEFVGDPITGYEGGVYFSESPTTWGKGVDGKPEPGHSHRLIAAKYDLETSDKMFRINFVFRYKNEEDEGEIGISFIEIIDETLLDERGVYKMKPYTTVPGVYIQE